MLTVSDELAAEWASKNAFISSTEEGTLSYNNAPLTYGILADLIEKGYTPYVTHISSGDNVLVFNPIVRVTVSNGSPKSYTIETGDRAVFVGSGVDGVLTYSD